MTRRRQRGTLDEAGGVGAMTAVLGIMLFLTVLAAASGLATAAAARSMGHDLAGRVTVQVAGGEAAAARVLAAMRARPGVTARPVAAAALARLVAPWLGEDANDPDLPLPVLIDATLADPGDGPLAALTTAVRHADPDAAIDRNAAWLAPVRGLLDTVTWLAAGLVLLMATATAAVVVLAARAGLERHRATIEVMHMMGATDVQVARLFQRRIARDAALGGAGGAAAALAGAALVGSRLAGLGSALAGGAALGAGDWIALALLPALFVVLATLAARLAVLRALRAMP